MEELKERPDRYSLLTALIMIIIGITVLIWPSETGTILVYVMGGLIAAAGLMRTVFYFARNERTGVFSFGGLTIGLTLLSIGVVLLFRPEVLKSILSIVLGCLLIFSGFGSLQTAIELARRKVPKWWLSFIFAVIAIVCGIIAVMEVINTAKTLMVFLGIALCMEGIFRMVLLVLFRKKV